MPFEEDGYSAALQKRIEGYVRKIEKQFGKATAELVKLAVMHYGGGKLISKMFSFDLKPALKKAAEDIFRKLSDNIAVAIGEQQRLEWLAASEKNDALVKYVFRRSKRKLSKEILKRFNDRNLNALSAFQGRKKDGLGLSERVWNIADQFKNEMELALDIGIGEGKSAAKVGQEVTRLLKYPDMIFRRVRDKHGNLKLSQAAKSFHPGQGVYRSSAKNAMRLTRTEINSVYRESDNLRRDQLDFVVGIEVRLSNNPNHCPTCEALAGRYPKSFRFRGWHPNCRCYTVSVLIPDSEMDAYLDRILTGESGLPVPSKNAVADTPAGFKQWLRDNSDRIRKNWKSLPWWMEENKGFVEAAMKGPLKLPKNPVPTGAHIVKNVPTGLNDYEKELNIKINKGIFGYLKAPVPIKSKAGKGAYFHPKDGYVNLPVDTRRRNSKWYSESVVYHEYGHALDWQYDIKSMSNVKELMEKYRKSFSENNDELFKKITDNGSNYLYKVADERNFDRAEQTGSLLDTIMSLNSSYGKGHDRSYYNIPGRPEAEFIAHAFSNRFKGNAVFKKFAPDLYKEMVKMINDILLKLK